MQATMRRTLDRRLFLAGGAAFAGAGLAGCQTTAATTSAAVAPGLAFYDRPPPLAPFRLHADRIFDITVCLRPFRAAGPRFDVEQIAGKTVVHNYGHGGSGWSLSWGSAQMQVAKALSTGETEIAVIGCGALGLTAALTAQKAGAKVTIYAAQRMPDVRSARATGTWSPESRIAQTAAVGPAFGDLWEQLTRTSFKAWRGWLSLPNDPVEFTDRYNLSDLSPADQRAERARTDTMHFVQYPDRVRDLTPRAQLLPSGTHPFPTAYVQRNSSLMFNITELGHTLTNDFLLAGGRIETKSFNSPSEFGALPQKVIINCTGYGARALMRDESVIPVRGQIAWLIPQPEVRYGLSYQGVTLLSRKDGIVVQGGGLDEALGFNETDEAPRRADAEAWIATLKGMYDRVRA